MYTFSFRSLQVTIWGYPGLSLMHQLLCHGPSGGSAVGALLRTAISTSAPGEDYSGDPDCMIAAPHRIGLFCEYLGWAKFAFPLHYLSEID